MTIPGTTPSFRIGTIGSDPVFREARVLATISAISSVFDISGYKVDSGKALNAAASKLKGYPSFGKAVYPERAIPNPFVATKEN